MNKAGPWQLATVILAALIILDLMGILRPLRPLDLDKYEQLEKKLQDERTEREMNQRVRMDSIALLTQQNDSLIRLNEMNETQKNENIQKAEDLVRILRDAPLDSVGIILTGNAPAGY